MPPAGVTMHVTGQRQVVARLAKELGENLPKSAAKGLKASGELVVADARVRASAHHWHGGLESGYHLDSVWVRPSGVTVNVRSKAPQGASFEKGWYSKSGMQPPAEALIPWITSRGIEPDPKKAKGLAFVMARAFRSRHDGYSFKPLHIVRKAVRSMRPAIYAILIRELRR